MRTQEKLIYTNERGESIEFSPASSYHVNFKDVTGLSDVRNAIYSTNSMGQDGDTYLGYRIESRDIDIVGYIKERDKQAAQNLRRKLNRILNPQYEATLTYVFGDFRRVIGCKIDDAPIFKRKPIFEQFTVSLSCLNPFWREETETREDIATWIGGIPRSGRAGALRRLGNRLSPAVADCERLQFRRREKRYPDRVPRDRRGYKSRIAERRYTGVYQAEYFACSGRRFNRFHGLR